MEKVISDIIHRYNFKSSKSTKVQKMLEEAYMSGVIDGALDSENFTKAVDFFKKLENI